MIVRTRSLFLRGLGVVFAIAFVSLWLQVPGLLGSDGLEPAGRFLAAVRRAIGDDAVRRVPTLFWLDASDGALSGACALGAGAGVLLALGIAPLVAAFACWALYLSLVNVGQDFLSYQWDALLLETGFLALFWAPLGLRLRDAAAPPSRVVLWLLRWLVFRLMFFSGWVKLASGDATWWDLTALAHHYETQPLPAPTSWYAHQLPLWAQKVSCAVALAIELAVPWLVFLGRRARAVACGAFLLLQATIAATGNYGFFNLLSAVLCVPLLDDAQLAAAARRLGVRLAPAPSAATPARPWRAARLARDVALAGTIGLLTVPAAIGQVLGFPRLPGALVTAYGLAQRFHVTGRYGLFAVMTTTRPEIRIEGSGDGERWKPYLFRWKPGPVDRAPRFAGPHMPRLDWQLWFDALYVERMLDGGRTGRDLVTPKLVDKLLDGSPAVRALLASDPFPDAPPRFVRWRLEDAHFTDAAERARTGAWWTRRPLYTSRALSRDPAPDDAPSSDGASRAGGAALSSPH